MTESPDDGDVRGKFSFSGHSVSMNRWPLGTLHFFDLAPSHDQAELHPFVAMFSSAFEQVQYLRELRFLHPWSQ
jgi:hypothetical protein